MELRTARPELEAFLAGKVSFLWDGRRITLDAPHGAFSQRRIDEGTRLLLDHLPGSAPGSFLDLGCGYGALGLVVALRFPKARGVLVDRDLLAVEFSRRNAAALALRGLSIQGSLGYRDLPPETGPFDWILANLPARAGAKALAALLRGGCRRLGPGGEMRVVILRELAADLSAAAAGLSLRQVAESAAHVVLALAPAEGPEPGEEVYVRDVVELDLGERLRLERPTDLADAPERLSAGLPLAAERLPDLDARRVLVVRCRYGALARLALARYPRAMVAAQDRDLLAAAFTRRNCAGFEARLAVEEEVLPQRALQRGPFDVVLGELSTTLGERAALEELALAREGLAAGGRAVFLGLAKQWREFLRDAAPSLGLTLAAERPPAALYELRGR
jgi:16S rRNA G1207 methylase RsmC